MAYKRTRYTRKRGKRASRATQTRKRGYRKARMSRPMKMVSNQIHTFRREFSVGQIIDTGANQNLVYSFNPTTQLPGLTEYQGLYDQIKIHKVIWTFEPLWTTSNTQSAYPIQKFCRYVHDFDDGTALTTEQQYFDYGNCKSRSLVNGRPFQIPLYPLMQMQGAGGVGAQLRKAGWLDIDVNMPTFYGIKMFVPTVALSNNNQIAAVRCTVVFSCRNSR